MYSYVNAVCSHQEQRQIGLSTIESYIARRTYTVGAYPCIMILEWAYGLNISSWVYEHEATKAIMKETTLSNLLINDILSFKKEVVCIPRKTSIYPPPMRE
ncbi:hypothetical protein VTN77DRAFT_8811 [Rasamsonia byssochlamydoides]|uniref:uncharacterized protein n=1 Tax=Rasamsonia byssochlamydoides TaxID=89139 RepID=UPI00374497CB